MTNAEIFENIKEMNKAVDGMNKVMALHPGVHPADFPEDSKKVYEDWNTIIELAMELFRVDARYKYHHGYDIHMSKRTGHYYVTFPNN